jgi:5-methylcytosine-specific restriction endonuclease McrA
MAQTHIGAMKVLAKKSGMSFSDFMNFQAAGNKWCWRCRNFHNHSAFNKDRSRYDGFVSVCRNSKNKSESKSQSLKLAWNKRLTEGYVHPMKGKRFSDDARRNMGRKPGFISELRGRQRSAEEKAKISKAVRLSPKTLRGPACRLFKDGKVSERRGIRFSLEYKRWRFDVFVRDKFTCQRCGNGGGGYLIAHHIKYFAEYPELRFNIDNGLTVCRPCHISGHRKEGYSNGRKI